MCACVLTCVPEISKEHPAGWNMKSVTDGSRNIEANEEKSAVGKTPSPLTLQVTGATKRMGAIN